MVFRQVLLGVSGGAVMALVALFLMIPRAVVEEQAPPWLLHFIDDSPFIDESKAPDASPEEVAPPDETIRDLDPTDLPESGLGQDERLMGPDSRLASLAPVAPGEGELALDAPSVQPPVAPSPDELDASSLLGALSKETIIRSRPDHQAQILGFARTGALLRRAKVPSGFDGCKEGWYRVEPSGYVCVGKAATLDPEHPLIRLASYQPDRSLPLPYPYGTSRYPTPPLYTRIPSKEEQAFAEQDLKGHLSKNFGAAWVDAADTPPPQLLAEGQMIPRPYGYPVLEHEFMTGRALGSSSFAFIDLFEAGGRRYGLTADLSLLPLDRLVPVKESEFHGVTLDASHKLPVVFVRSSAQYLYEGSIEEGSVRPFRPISYREAFHLTGRELPLYGAVYLETEGGTFIKDVPQLVHIEARDTFPKWAKDGRSWIDISILHQTLVAYRGDRPVFATLVSTGKDGLGDPEETHSTAQGIFLIHTKHVTSTMSGDEADDEFDLRDVPYVQYFHQGYALHAAFWHDSFGQPRSHGCVNLSPSDARQLFSLTEPPVPLRWHSALSHDGTLVYIHP